MSPVKTFIFNNFKTLTVITSFSFISMFLLMVRLKLTHSFFYLFLVWNLFLATVPFVISTWLKHQNRLSKPMQLLTFSIWLLFLPNAPYIVTDLIHLRLSHASIIWFDTIMISAFALCGLLLFFYSLRHIRTILLNQYSRILVNFLMYIALILSSFGVYLGRFLRYNSWEIISNPQHLFIDIFSIVFQPHQNTNAWLFILSFSVFLIITHQLFKWKISK